MIRIAFYLSNKGISSVDCSEILKGNPGIGGSEYAILSIATYLTLNYSSLLDVYVIANAVSNLPSGLKTIKVESFDAMPAALDECGAKILVLKHAQEIPKRNSLSIFKARDVKVVMWAHNFLTRKELCYYANHKIVSRIVTVGKEQLDLYRDHRAFQKSTSIYNGYNIKTIQNSVDPLLPFKDREPIVTYIGSLIKAKGFHLLAKAWPDVLRSMPDAKLHVIGSGKLYDRSCRLGRLGIAEESYEESFSKYITNEQGVVLPSITFHGVLGIEKANILGITKVGVPNPSGNTETFGYTALELQSYGALVTTQKCPGYMETVKNGILYNKSDALSKAIVDLLNRSDNDLVGFLSYAERKFSFSVVSNQWYQLLLEIDADAKIKSNSPIENMWYKLKWLRELNRRFKMLIPFGSKLPSVMFYENSIDQLKKRTKRLIKTAR